MNDFSSSAIKVELEEAEAKIDFSQVPVFEIKTEPELLIRDDCDDPESMEFKEEDQNAYEIKMDTEDNETSEREFLTESENEYQTDAEEDEETNAVEENQQSKLLPKTEYDLRNLLHVCPMCGDEFENENRKAWTSHLTAKHELDKVDKLNYVTIVAGSDLESNDRHFKCTICAKVFTKLDLRDMKNHAYLHMPFRISKCKICGTGYSAYKRTPCKCHGNKNDFFMMRNCTLLCSKCDAPFEDGKQLKIHMGTEHNTRLPEDLSFKRVGKIGNHTAMYECTKCQLQRTSRGGQSFDAMLRHAAIHDNHKMYQCNHCKKTYMRACHFKTHEATKCQTALLKRMHSRFDKYSKILCPACGQRCTSQETFEEHIKNVHSLTSMKSMNVVKEKDELKKCLIHKCKICDHVFQVKNMRVYKNHAFQHMPYKMHNCTICDRGFDTQLEIANHLKSEHNVDNDIDVDKNSTKCQADLNMLFICPVCNKELESQDTQMQHIDKEHQLNTTLMGVAMKIVVIYDQKGAEVKKVYECLECGKQIRQNSNPTQRLQHRMTHLPYKPYKCKQCKATLCQFKYLREHVVNCKMLTASDLINTSGITKKFSEFIKYACPECNIPITTLSEWEIHIQQNHSFFAELNFIPTDLPDSKRHKCTECGALVAGGLLNQKRHKLRHMPFSSFVCRLCCYRSNSFQPLVEHLRRIHFKPGTFKCPICSLVLETSYKCAKHCRTDHTPDQYPPQFCSSCMVLYSCRKEWKLHLDLHDSNGQINKQQQRLNFECLICFEKFCGRLKLEEHIKAQHCSSDDEDVPAVLGPLTCRYCHRKFKTTNCIRGHFRRFHQNQKTKPGPRKTKPKTIQNYDDVILGNDDDKFAIVKKKRTKRTIPPGSSNKKLK